MFSNKSIENDNPENYKYSNLYNYINQAGGDTTKVRLEYYSQNNRGVHANQHIKKGEIVL